MDTFIPLKDMLMFFIFCLIMCVGVFLIILFYNLIKLVKRANKILEDNAESLNQTLVVMPEVTKNVNDVALSVKGNMDMVGNTIGGFGEAISETATTLGERSENVLNFIKIVSNVVNTILSFFSSAGKKERKDSDKQ